MASRSRHSVLSSAKTSFSVLLALLAFCFPALTLAIEIDDFSEDGGSIEVVATASSPIAVSGVSGINALGGARKRAAQVSFSSGARLTTSILSGRYTHSQDVSSSGESAILWDGDSDPTRLLSNGLPGLDLLQGSATAFVLRIGEFDYPDQRAISIRIEVYDAADDSGSLISSASLVVDEAVNSAKDFELPFSLFSEGASFSNVGAIRLIIQDVPATDLALVWFGTNGTCPLVPDSNGSVFDVCGKCPLDSDYVLPDGPLKSCLDCASTPFGDFLPGASCQSGEPGACATGVLGNSCECIPPEPRPELCDGADNDCDGEVDETFEELGTSCGVEDGACSTSGIFVCSSEGGITCEGEIDLSGLNGCDIEIGCDGIPGSGLKPDRCGVCGGDGLSCSESCESVEISELLVSMDSNAKAQEKQIRRSLKRLVRLSGSKADRKFREEVMEEAERLQLENWTLSWTIPSVTVTCPAEIETCIQVSNVSTVANYLENSVRLRKLSMQVARRLFRRGVSASRFTRLRRQAKRGHRESISLTAEVPETQARCF